MNAMRNLAAVCAVSALVGGGCFAQTAAAPVAKPAPAAAPVAVAPAAPAAVAPAAVAPVTAAPAGAAPLLRQGTEIRLKTMSPLSSKFSKLGDRFELLTTEDLKVNGQVVIPAGTRGVGEVTKVEKKGAFGKSGKLDTRVVYLALGDQRIAMTGQSHEAGAGGTAGTVAAAVLVGVFSAFVTGKSAEYPAGTSMVAYVENDTPVTGR